MKYLTGYRTYIVAVLGVVLAGLKSTGHISDADFQAIVTLLGSLGLAALRAAV